NALGALGIARATGLAAAGLLAIIPCTSPVGSAVIAALCPVQYFTRGIATHTGFIRALSCDLSGGAACSPAAGSGMTASSRSAIDGVRFSDMEYAVKAWAAVILHRSMLHGLMACDIREQAHRRNGDNRQSTTRRNHRQLNTGPRQQAHDIADVEKCLRDNTSCQGRC